MENNRTVPDSYYDYADYSEYSNFRNSSPMRNEMLKPKVLPQPSAGNKLYYTEQDTFSDYYPEEQLWNMQTRRIPNSSYTTFQNSNYTTNNPQVQKRPKKPEMPLKGILLNGPMENGLEGQGRNSTTKKGNNTNPQHRPKSPVVDYRLPVYRSNEDLMAAFCGGEPVSEKEDSQYYLIHDEKIEQNYNTEKNIYEDFNLPTDNGSSYKDPNAYEFNTPDNEAFYDSSLRELATLDLRERPPQQMYTNSNYGNSEDSTYETTDDGYYMLSQSAVNRSRSPQTYNQNRYQNITRNGNLKKSVNRREVYKNVSEKLNETFTELKNAGVNDKKEENRPRSRHINSAERYSLHKHPESGKKPIQNVQGDYNFDKMEYKEGDSFTNRQYKYQDIDANTNRQPRMSQLENYKPSSHNELINPSLRFSSCQKQEVSSHLKKKKIQMASEDQKIKKNTFLESGSFVHMHKEYSKNQSVPDCCVDVYNSYRKEKIPINMLRTE